MIQECAELYMQYLELCSVQNCVDWVLIICVLRSYILISQRQHLSDFHVVAVYSDPTIMLLYLTMPE